MTFLEISPADSPLVIGLPHTGLDLPEDVRDALNVSCGTIRLPASGATLMPVMKPPLTALRHTGFDCLES